MTVKELQDKLEKCNPMAIIWPQIVTKDGSAWNMNLELNVIDGTNLLQFKIFHEDLETLDGLLSEEKN